MRRQKPHKSKNKNENRYVALNYHNNFSNKIASIYKRHGLTPAFKTSNSLHKKLYNVNKNNSRGFDKYNTSGIYRINCNECNATYIGKTERSFNKRFQEHLKNSTSNVHQHNVEKNHSISNIDKSLDIIHKCNDKQMLNVLESLEIRRAVLNGEQLLNTQLDLNKSATAINDLCCRLAENS